MHDLIRVTLWSDVRPRISRASRRGAFQISLPAPFSSTDFNYLVQPSRLPDITICDSEAARPCWGAGHIVESHRYISPRLSIARLNRAPFPDTLAQVYMNKKYKRKETRRDTLIRSRWSRSRSCISPVLLFLLLLLLLLHLFFAKS